MYIYILNNISYFENEDEKDYKLIGLFSTYEKAQVTAKLYSENVSGFNSYPNEFKIEKLYVRKSCKKVWLLQSFTVDNDGMEEDFKAVGAYPTRLETEIKKLTLIFKENRKYDIERHNLDERYWQEGFVRIFE